MLVLHKQLDVSFPSDNTHSPCPRNRSAACRCTWILVMLRRISGYLSIRTSATCPTLFWSRATSTICARKDGTERAPTNEGLSIRRACVMVAQLRWKSPNDDLGASRGPTVEMKRLERTQFISILYYIIHIL